MKAKKLFVMRSFLMAYSATSESVEKLTPNLCPGWILSNKWDQKRKN